MDGRSGELLCAWVRGLGGLPWSSPCGWGSHARALLTAGLAPSPCSDPDSVVLCLLATDEEDEDDIALQIHFTLIQAFCCDNDIHILRVSGMQRLATLLGEGVQDSSEPRDLHCILVTVGAPRPPLHRDSCGQTREKGAGCRDVTGGRQGLRHAGGMMHPVRVAASQGLPEQGH